ncbi:hypothetical protein HOH45_05305 [bacterium]|jgi:hypothetical protein|nr:hypothetical protein [bacterium]
MLCKLLARRTAPLTLTLCRIPHDVAGLIASDLTIEEIGSVSITCRMSDDYHKRIQKCLYDREFATIGVDKNHIKKLAGDDFKEKYMAYSQSLGLGKEQLASLTSRNLKTIHIEYFAYTIPPDILTQLETINDNNGTLNLNNKAITTGQLLKIINHLTDPQKTQLDSLLLNNNNLIILPQSITTLTSLSYIRFSKDVAKNTAQVDPDLDTFLTKLIEVQIIDESQNN